MLARGSAAAGSREFRGSREESAAWIEALVSKVLASLSEFHGGAAAFAIPTASLIIITALTYTFKMLKAMGLLALLLSLGVIEISICAALLPFRWQGAHVTSSWADALFLLASFMSFTLLAIGVVGFVSPRTVQDYALRQNTKWFPANPFLEWMNTANYIRFIRIIGLMAYILGLFAVFLLLKIFQETVFI